MSKTFLQHSPLDPLKNDLQREMPLPQGPSDAIIDEHDVVLSTRDHKSSYFLGKETPANEVTLFKIASITKSMTSALIFKLQEMGVLSVADPITQYLDYDAQKGELV